MALRSGERPTDIAWDESLRAAAAASGRTAEGGVPRPGRPHLRRKVRARRAGRLLLFAVDLSGSMGTRTMQLAKRVALGLLEEAYVQRDRIALVAFRGDAAEQLFAPTNQVALVRRAMAEAPCGGTTPLSFGLQVATRTMQRAARRDAARLAFLLLITDGRANVGTASGASHRETIAEVQRVARRMAGLETLLLDTTEAGQSDYWARWLARLLGAERVSLRALRQQGDDPLAAVRRWLASRG